MNGSISGIRHRAPKTYSSTRLPLVRKLPLVVLVGTLILALSPLAVLAQEIEPQTSQELELLKEEETESIASRYEQPLSEAPLNVYVITDEDIRMSGAADLPTALRRIPGIEVMQVTGAYFNISARCDNHSWPTRCWSWLTVDQSILMPKGPFSGRQYLLPYRRLRE